MKISTHQKLVRRDAGPLLWCLVSLLWLLTPRAYADEPLDCVIEPHVLVDVSSSEIGVLASLEVDEAEVVHKGDSLATLHMDVERAAFAVTRARAQFASEIELLKRDHDFNARRRDRIEELHVEKSISTQDVDEMRTAHNSAWLRLQAAIEKQRTAQLEAARDELALARRVVKSPINGVVVRKHKSAGEFVDGDPVVQLAQLDPLLIRVVVPISMYGQIHEGMQASVIPELPVEGPFVATVVSIDPMMDAATATMGIRLSLPNPEHRLPPGLKCTLEFQLMEENHAEVEYSTVTHAAAESVVAHDPPDSDDPPQLGAATIDTRSIKPKRLENTNTPNIRLDVANTSDHDSCVTLGPLRDSAVTETVSAVLDSGKVRFVRRYAAVNSKRSTESMLWFDIVHNSDNPMHGALLTSIRAYYPALQQLPFECQQVVTRQ